MNAAPFTHGSFRVHGGKVEAARAAFPGAPEPWLDLSTGICPWSYPLAQLSADTFTRLPEPETIAALEQAAADAFGVPEASRVIATPGSDQALRLAGAILADRQVAVVRPGYSGHLLAWSAGPVDEIRVEDLAWASRQYEVVVLCNPSNPEGRVVDRGSLLAAADALAARGGLLLVDEAFADASPELSVAGHASPGLMVFRSFGKFFGLAGLRLGFVVVSPEHAPAFRQLLGDWPVTGPTAAIATAAYRDRDWQAAQRLRLREGSHRLDAILRKAGLELAGGTVLFRLARCRDADAKFRQLAAAGVLSRPFSSDSTLLRIGLAAGESQWNRLASALGVSP